LPIIVILLNESMYARIQNNDRKCRICQKSLVKMKVGDPILRKTAGKSMIAHIECGIEKNWITRSDFDKLYLPLVSFTK